jgi:hypothetical protein
MGDALQARQVHFLKLSLVDGGGLQTLILLCYVSA